MSKQSSQRKLGAKNARWIEFLQEYSFVLYHHAGTEIKRIGFIGLPRKEIAEIVFQCGTCHLAKAVKSNTCLYTTLPIQHTLGTLVEEKYCNRDLILPSVELAFNNSVNHCTGTLSHEAKEAFLSALVSEGRAEWMDKGHKKCLILWHRIQDWADLILRFVRENGLEDSVMTVEEIRSGTESRGTELHGMDRTVLMRALKQLEHKGKLAIFKGTSADDEGVKFSL
ncbi:Vacuolar protein sorting-associated protein 25 [Vitis vinifera]|uniref:ESCRT-II complex subunit VPS25 n=1 Tax=Vitis vinifera TaxID=29760 RepID=A0A438H7P9_VITVI|nr:Vacuolar protein sorting-associated protein 25 [Vitis vinifera]